MKTDQGGLEMKEKNGEHPFGDVGQLILFGLFLIVWAVDSFFLRTSTFLSAYIPLSIRLSILGFALLAGVYLVRSGHAVVSHVNYPARVVRTGAFRYVRHPLYLGTVLFYFGLTVSTVSLFSLAAFVIIFFFYNYIASFEEKVLNQRFGEEYRMYMINTGKWLPLIGRGN
jgi:protein-S-isoprenylcysteine O-methyltransferase Ste14